MARDSARKSRKELQFERKLSQRSGEKIGVKIGNFKLASPTMLASGILGISFELFPRIVECGAGAVVTKSIGLEPREGYSNPTIAAVEGGYLNAIGLANPGITFFKEELEVYERTAAKKVPLIISIFADSAAGFAQLAGELDPFTFLAIELNLSCPHVKNVGSEIGTDPNEASEIVREVKKRTSKPILAKMPAAITDVPEWARSVERSGADAIVAINTIRAMKIDIESRKPILSNKIGGLSGPAIRTVAIRCVYEIYETVRIPVIGVGGVSTPNDAIEFLLAGATAVQVGSSISDPCFLEIFRRINDGLLAYMKRFGFKEIKELIGAAHS